jgi:hypothetical protein
VEVEASYFLELLVLGDQEVVVQMVMVILQGEQEIHLQQVHLKEILVDLILDPDGGGGGGGASASRRFFTLQILEMMGEQE